MTHRQTQRISSGRNNPASREFLRNRTQAGGRGGGQDQDDGGPVIPPVPPPIYSEGPYSARPAQGTPNTEFYATDIGVFFIDDGVSWTVNGGINGATWKFFEDEGFITPAMVVELAGLTTFPTADSTIMPAGGAIAVIDSVTEFDYAAAFGSGITLYDLSQARGEMLWICGVHQGINALNDSTGIFIQTTTVLGASDMDDGYLLQVSVDTTVDGP